MNNLIAPKQLYPRSRSKYRRDKSGRRWRVDYDLTYDGGGGSWSGYYRTKTGAKVSAWLNVYIKSWGGSAVLFQQS